EAGAESGSGAPAVPQLGELLAQPGKTWVLGSSEKQNPEERDEQPWLDEQVALEAAFDERVRRVDPGIDVSESSPLQYVAVQQLGQRQRLSAHILGLPESLECVHQVRAHEDVSARGTGGAHP